MKTCLIIVIVLLTIGYSIGFAQETVNPPGSAVTIRYSLSQANLRTSDTLVITRIVVNKTSGVLSNLYLSDNLPSQLRVVSSTARVNGSGVPIGLVGPNAGAVVSGTNGYWWVLDSPVSGETWNRSLNPNDSFSLQIKIVCSQAGVYSLPFHSTVCSGANNGLFSTASAVSVTFSSVGDITPPAAIIDLGDINDYSSGSAIPRCSATSWKVSARAEVG